MDSIREQRSESDYVIIFTRRLQPGRAEFVWSDVGEMFEHEDLPNEQIHSFNENALFRSTFSVFCKDKIVALSDLYLATSAKRNTKEKALDDIFGR